MEYQDRPWIAYWKNGRRQGELGEHKVDCLKYIPRPKGAQGQSPRTFVGFLPAMSRKAAMRIRANVRS